MKRFFNDRVLEAFKGNAEAANNAFLRFSGIMRSGTDIEASGKSISMKDAISLPNASIMVPVVMSEVVREAIEPILIGERLLTRIDYAPGIEVMMPDLGALAYDEVGHNNMEYPETDLDIGQGQTSQMRVTRYGGALKISDRVLKYDLFGIYNMGITKLGQAGARHKERKIFQHIVSAGTTVFDNVTPAAATKGATTGRALNGLPNGSFTADDLFDMYAQCMAQGFLPDTILVHPLSWAVWMKDPVLRTFAIENGGGSFFSGWDGNFNQRSGWSNFGGMGEGQGQNVNFDPLSGSAASAYQQTMDSKPRIPSYFPFPLRVVASPFMPFTEITVGPDTVKVTDIIMFDSKNLGLLVVEDEPMVEEWREIKNMFNYVRLSESYGIHIQEQNQGIVAARNVYLTSNQVEMTVRPTLDASALTAPPFTAAPDPTP